MYVSVPKLTAWRDEHRLSDLKVTAVCSRLQATRCNTAMHQPLPCHAHLDADMLRHVWQLLRSSLLSQAGCLLVCSMMPADTTETVETLRDLQEGICRTDNLLGN